MNSIPPDPPTPPEERPRPQPAIPEAWHQPPEDERKWSPSAAPKERSMGQEILRFIGWGLLVLAVLVIIGVLLLLGTCFVMLNK